MIRAKASIVHLIIAINLFPCCAIAQPTPTQTNVNDLAQFEHRALLSKELGATHVVITNDLPPAVWQFNPPDDPYPAWFINNPSLMKLFPPKEVAPFVDMQYAEHIHRILIDRCAILRKLGLKAHWNSNEPQVLPEAFFTKYPQLRGPRVDQPNRSRIAWFAPCVDEPETLRLYREAIKNMLARCPEIESFSFLTSDSGSGFCWVPGLYPGINGNSNCKDRPMEQRVSGFLTNLQQAAREAGHEITINVNPVATRQWMTPSFSPEVLNAIVRLLPRGLVVSGREGPDGRAFAGGGGGAERGGPFYPVVGIVLPSMSSGGGVFGGGGRGAGDPTTTPAQRIMINLGDETTLEFNYRLQKATRGQPARNLIERLTNLRAFAATEVGEPQADNLLEIWSSLTEVDRGLNALNFGGMLRFGHVLNRWVIRPMVPFPEELTPEDKKDYRRFILQAKGEEQANDLIDIQAMRMYEGWGAKMLFQRVIENNTPQVRSAISRAQRIATSAGDDLARRNWELMGKRLEALLCLLNSADYMVSYQAHLDRIRNLKLKPEENPPLGTSSDWARTDVLELARKEIDNMVRLRELLQSNSEPILDTAPTSEEETIMRLGPNLPAQIKHKIDVMNAHWRDYDRIFTVPNP